MAKDSSNTGSTDSNYQQGGSDSQERSTDFQKDGVNTGSTNTGRTPTTGSQSNYPSDSKEGKKPDSNFQEDSDRGTSRR